MEEIEVVVDVIDEAEMAAKVSSARWELNVRASRADLLKLASIRDANWEARRSIEAGTSAGSAVFWSCDGHEVTAMVGHDDETWDFSVAMPIRVVDELVLHAHDT